MYIRKRKYRACVQVIILSILMPFLGMSITPVAYAQSVANLPAPGTMVSLSPIYTPAIVEGITIYPDNPLQFDFIVDVGDDNLQGEALRKEIEKLISYFMATLTVPEDEMWVNLSPYEKDRIIADGLGDTVMGRDMLAQDYILKQLTASLMYPEDKLGSEFWQRVYEKAQSKFGTTEIPTNTFNKIWIVPDEAIIYANGTNIFVADSRLKVMLEEDYLALEHHDKGLEGYSDDMDLTKETKTILREVLLPEIEREVNEGKNFATLRQMYNSMILATWYKNNLKESVLGRVYIDQNKVNGIDVEDKDIKNKIYNQYIKAFEKGVYNYIKEDYDAATQQVIPRKYFSGGLGMDEIAKALRNTDVPQPNSRLSQRRNRPKVRARVNNELSISSSPISEVPDGTNRRTIEKVLNGKISGTATIQFDPKLLVKIVTSEQHQLILEQIDEKIDVEKAEGQYLKFLRIKDNEGTTIYIASKELALQAPIDRDSTWIKRREISELMFPMIDVNSLEIIDLNSPHTKFNIAIDTVHAVNKSTLGVDATDDNVLRAFFLNTQARFNEIVDSYQRGENSYDLELYAEYGVQNLAYSHLRHFAWIYWKELLQLRKILNENSEKEEVVVLDLGTGGGNFILTAAYFLSDQELSRIKFIGLDQRSKDKKFGIEMAEKIEGLSVQWVEDNITSRNFDDRLSAYNADLIVVNHVMEHLSGEVVDYLSTWSEVAVNSLMVSIPLGDDLDSSISDHEHDFDVAEVEKIAKNVEENLLGIFQAENLDETKYGGLWTFKRVSSGIQEGITSSPISKDYGGIDFNAGNLNLKEQGQAIDINFTNIPNIQANTVNGVTPVIINITPIFNFPLLLGEAEINDNQLLSQL